MTDNGGILEYFTKRTTGNGGILELLGRQMYGNGGILEVCKLLNTCISYSKSYNKSIILRILGIDYS